MVRGFAVRLMFRLDWAQSLGMENSRQLLARTTLSSKWANECLKRLIIKLTATSDIANIESI